MEQIEDGLSVPALPITATRYARHRSKFLFTLTHHQDDGKGSSINNIANAGIVGVLFRALFLWSSNVRESHLVSSRAKNTS